MKCINLNPIKVPVPPPAPTFETVLNTSSAHTENHTRTARILKNQHSRPGYSALEHLQEACLQFLCHQWVRSFLHLEHTAMLWKPDYVVQWFMKSSSFPSAGSEASVPASGHMVARAHVPGPDESRGPERWAGFSFLGGTLCMSWVTPIRGWLGWPVPGCIAIWLIFPPYCFISVCCNKLQLSLWVLLENHQICSGPGILRTENLSLNQLPNTPPTRLEALPSVCPVPPLGPLSEDGAVPVVCSDTSSSSHSFLKAPHYAFRPGILHETSAW